MKFEKDRDGWKVKLGAKYSLKWWENLESGLYGTNSIVVFFRKPASPEKEQEVKEFARKLSPNGVSEKGFFTFNLRHEDKDHFGVLKEATKKYL